MGYLLSLSKSAATVGFEVSEWMLLIFGGVLVLGIFGEYKKLPKRLLLLWPTTVFEILVMVGVAGELLGDGGVFVFSSHLQSIEDNELSDMGSNAQQLEARLKVVGDKASEADLTAGTASTRSTNAVSASQTALTLARGARQEADTFEKRLGGAERTAVEAESKVAEAHNEALAAKRALDEYKAPREVTPQQQAQISARIRPFATRIDVLIIGNTMEVLNIQKSLVDAIRGGGWTIGNIGIPMGGISATGLTVLTHIGASAKDEQAANSLVSALLSAGLATGRNGSQFNDDLPAALTGNWDATKTAQIRIVIGAKPTN